MSNYRVTRVRRSALPIGTNFQLMGAKVGDRVDLTIHGVRSKAEIAELASEWVEFRSGDDRTEATQ